MYDPQEIKDIMLAQDSKVGNFKETKEEKNKVKRLRRIAKFSENTHFVIENLIKWGIPFTLCEVLHSEKQRHRVTTDIFIPNANIVMRQVNVDDEVEMSKASSFYQAMKCNFYPFFIRSNEDKEFIEKKLIDVIQKANDKPQIGFKNVKFVKAKRPRIKAVKVEPKRR